MVEGPLEEGSDPLLLLLSVAQADGHALPTGAYTARILAEQVRTITGSSPVTVNVMNDREAIIELKPDSVVVHVAQALQATRTWDGYLVDITCVISLHHSEMHVIHEWKMAHSHLQQLENEACHFQSEQQLSQDQIVELFNRFSFKVKCIVEMKKK